MYKSRLVKSIYEKYVLILFFVFLVVFLILAIEPYGRSDWALENVLVVISVLVLATTYKRFVLSNKSYTFIFLFLCLHEIGAHYTYSIVPYNEWSKYLFHEGLNDIMQWERNHFDRLGHMFFGLLLAYPVREILLKICDCKGFLSYFLPLNIIMSFSMLFELIEWAAALIFGGELAMNYLGIQGDIWDAHQDMLMSSLGALFSYNIIFFLEYKHQQSKIKE